MYISESTIEIRPSEENPGKFVLTGDPLELDTAWNGLMDRWHILVRPGREGLDEAQANRVLAVAEHFGPVAAQTSPGRAVLSGEELQDMVGALSSVEANLLTSADPEDHWVAMHVSPIHRRVGEALGELGIPLASPQG